MASIKAVEGSIQNDDKLYYILNRVIYKELEAESEHLSGEVEMYESYFGSKRKRKRERRAYNKMPTFGIWERNRKVKVEIVNDVSAETLLS